MFTALVLMMLVAVALSFLGREKAKAAAPPVPLGKPGRRVASNRATIPRALAIVLFMISGAGFLALALAMDYHVVYQPTVSKTAPAPPPPEGVGPGPGWKVEHGTPLPPSGFTGRTAVRFEQGVTGKGYVVVAKGQFKRIGSRVTGQDAAYCFLDVELLSRPEHRKLDQEGYSYTDTVLEEGWHEAKVQAWCPPDHPNARFAVATMGVDAGGRPEGNGSWSEAGDDDIRHR